MARFTVRYIPAIDKTVVIESMMGLLSLDTVKMKAVIIQVKIEIAIKYRISFFVSENQKESMIGFPWG